MPGRGFFEDPSKTVHAFCISLQDRSIQDLSDHGASWEPKKSTLGEGSSVPLMHHDPNDLALIRFVKKRKIHLRILLDLKIQQSNPVQVQSSICLKKRSLRLEF